MTPYAGGNRGRAPALGKRPDRAGDRRLPVSAQMDFAEQWRPQSLQGKRLAVVALPHNRRRAIIDRVKDIADTLRCAHPGEHIVIEIDGTRTIRRIVDGVLVEERLPAVANFRF